jgi:hypothetical protein
MGSSAAFRIGGSPASAGGYDIAAGATVALQLESIAPDVLSCVFSVLRTTSGAPVVTIAGGGVASPPTAIVDLTVPGGLVDAHSWMLLSTITVEESGVVIQKTHKRMLVFRHPTTNRRKIVKGESVEYDPVFSWPNEYNSAVVPPSGGAANLDPSGTLELAKVNSPGVTVGDTAHHVAVAVDATTARLSSDVSTVIENHDSSAFVSIRAGGVAATGLANGTLRLRGQNVEIDGNVLRIQSPGTGVVAYGGNAFAAPRRVDLLLWVRAIATSDEVLTDGTVDGVALSTGDIVLLAGQTNPIENGPRWWTGSGLSRLNDFAAGLIMPRYVVAIAAEGSNAGEWWQHSTATAVVTGTDGSTWTQFGAGGGATYSRVTKGNADTLDAGEGILNDLTSGTQWDLPALSGVADGESVYVVHPWATSDSAQIDAAGADVINGGDGHASDTSFALTEYQGRIRFQKVNSEWRVSTEGNANAASGGGSSLTDGTATLTLATGSMSETGLVNWTLTPTGFWSVTATGAATLVGSTLSIGTTLGGITIDGSGNLGTSGITSINLALDGGGAYVDIGQSDPLDVYVYADNLIRIQSPATIVEQVGSASRTVTASGAHRTETYGGTLTMAVPDLVIDCADNTIQIDVGSISGAVSNVSGVFTFGDDYCQLQGTTFASINANEVVAQAFGASGLSLQQSTTKRYRHTAAVSELRVGTDFTLAVLDSAGNTRCEDHVPTKTTLASGAATTCATIAASASVMKRIQGTVFARLSSDWAVWDVDVTLDPNATATKGLDSITLLDSGGAGSGWTLAATPSTGDLLLQATAATSVVVTPDLRIMRAVA